MVAVFALQFSNMFRDTRKRNTVLLKQIIDRPLISCHVSLNASSWNILRLLITSSDGK